jgi:hypothetical protein
MLLVQVFLVNAVVESLLLPIVLVLVIIVLVLVIIVLVLVIIVHLLGLWLNLQWVLLIGRLLLRAVMCLIHF